MGKRTDARTEPVTLRDTLVDDEGADEDDRSDVRRRKGPGQRIGDTIAERYQLVALLGEGGAGAVYSAIDRAGGRRVPVALKVLHQHLRGVDGHSARFQREIKALSEIAHSAVVRVRDSGTDELGHMYLAMELLEGELLSDVVEEGLETREVLEIGRQLLGALAAAHDRGIVHRDIKPDNLFLATAPEGVIRLKVLDWGIAKLTRPDRAISFQTLDGLILGTPEYMSPELCRGAPVTEAADLWAAAAVLFELLSGAPPFEEEQIGRLLLRIVRERAPLLGELRPDLPSYVTAAIDKALDPDLERRWKTARAFATGLATAAPIDDLDWD